MGEHKEASKHLTRIMKSLVVQLAVHVAYLEVVGRRESVIVVAPRMRQQASKKK